MSPKVKVQRGQQWLLHMQYVLYHTPDQERIEQLGVYKFRIL